MPSRPIHTSAWHLDSLVTRSVFQSPDGKIRFYVHIRRFTVPNQGYCTIEPASHLGPTLFQWWLSACRLSARYDPGRRAWVWPYEAARRLLTDVAPTPESLVVAPTSAPATPSPEDRLRAKRERELAAQRLDAEFSKLVEKECIPVAQWPDYQYPSHLPEHALKPVALQRILVSKYWPQYSFILCASVGTGKTRMVVDILNSRQLCPASVPNHENLVNSAKIVLVIAPLTLHGVWEHEFRKWTPVDADGRALVDWRVHIYSGSNAKKFWRQCNANADAVLNSSRPGGIVIITTPQMWSRDTIGAQFHEHEVQPTTIVIDEAQRAFRNPGNKSFQNVMLVRRHAFGCIALTGTPTNKPVDWWGLEEVVGGGDPAFHWRSADYMQYYNAFNPDDRSNCAPLVPEKTSVASALKSFHIDRINRGQSFVALKEFYMADSLPGLGQSEIGLFAEQRMTFNELCERYPDKVAEALERQKTKHPKWSPQRSDMLAIVILLRMQEISGTSPESEAVLRSFIDDFLEKDEPAVVWTNYIEEQDHVVKLLAEHGPVARLSGATDPKERKPLIDAFQEGRYRFFCAQTDAGGVGVTLTRANKCLFNTSPLSYLNLSQAIGRLHRIGQTEDVTSYFNMSHPVSMFLRRIHDTRAEANELLSRELKNVSSPLVSV